MQRFVSEIKEHAMEYGSIPFWSWNDKLEPDELRRQIRVMHDMHARGSLETEYLSEEWYECIRTCVDEAEKQEGENMIALKLYNSNRNLLGPHHFIDPEPLGVSPGTLSLESQWEDEQCAAFAERYAFVRFGIDC